MRIYLVRHAKAGDRGGWRGPDLLRPLSKRGRRQAAGLADLLGQLPITRIVSSPFARCIETVDALAQRRGLPVEVDDALGEGQQASKAIEVLASLPDHGVACSHGDVVPETIDALQQCYGMDVIGPADWRKGVTWVLEREGGRWVTARAIPPPPGDRDDPPVSPLTL